MMNTSTTKNYTADETIRHLCSLLQSKNGAMDSREKKTIISLLGIIGDPLATDTLATLLFEESDPSIQFTIILALKNINDPHATSILLQYTNACPMDELPRTQATVISEALREISKQRLQKLRLQS